MYGFETRSVSLEGCAIPDLSILYYCSRVTLHSELLSNLQSGPKIFMRASCGTNNLVAGRDYKFRPACNSGYTGTFLDRLHSVASPSRRIRVSRRPTPTWGTCTKRNHSWPRLWNATTTQSDSNRSSWTDTST